jgi:protein-disulfide isomerase
VKGESLLNISVGVLTLCALVTTGFVVRREISPPPHTLVPPRKVPTWRSFSKEGHRMGLADAPVTIVVFSDFQCPFCARLTDQLHFLRNEYPSDVAVVYRHFPLAMHQHAIAAVRASECASAQGRFEEFHDAMFAEQDSVAVGSWNHFAKLAGIQDMAAFNQCTACKKPFPALARDTIAGRKLEVEATPTLLINATRLVGAQPLDTLEAYVRRVLHDKHSSRQ